MGAVRTAVPVLLLLSLLGCRSEPPPEERPQAWQQVATWTGRGNQQLETFPIGSWIWRVRWEAKDPRTTGGGTLKVTAHSGDSGRQIAEIANVRGVDHDITYVTDLPRSYYLVVNSANVDWSLVVEEPVIR
jgi:hypothetical protein